MAMKVKINGGQIKRPNKKHNFDSVIKKPNEKNAERALA